MIKEKLVMLIMIYNKKVSVECANHSGNIYIYFGSNNIIWNKKDGPRIRIWRKGELFILDTADFDIDKLREFLR